MSTEREKDIAKLPVEARRVLYVRNLPMNASSEEMYDMFGSYGSVFQIRIGNTKARCIVLLIVLYLYSHIHAIVCT
ncbi:hypothetical protein KIPB_007181 [Kipferlia bialata]|uniref:RRM domain-containing protein n=1 Tax=Kipferlia bialata TaxID=797122 RepID=A0A9K3CZY2_9EUKA|nr:hypothetical protein KIPB_007181 [Kipferlia bialata]|eukprot:g7181.t1